MASGKPMDRWFVAMSVSAKRRLPCVRRLLPQFPATGGDYRTDPRFWRASTCKLSARLRICRGLSPSCRVWYRKMRDKRGSLPTARWVSSSDTRLIVEKHKFQTPGLVVVDEEQHFGVAIRSGKTCATKCMSDATATPFRAHCKWGWRACATCRLQRHPSTGWRGHFVTRLTGLFS
ncbi:MAG: hypothetical protein CM15mP21_8420 [Hyphomicrobiales bacterium]|nr:MAG: hypothetical protein CM15mP21_8420 [Hyphomicrobiales bacterium]